MKGWLQPLSSLTQLRPRGGAPSEGRAVVKPRSGSASSWCQGVKTTFVVLGIHKILLSCRNHWLLSSKADGSLSAISPPLEGLTLVVSYFDSSENWRKRISRQHDDMHGDKLFCLDPLTTRASKVLTLNCTGNCTVLQIVHR